MHALHHRDLRPVLMVTVLAAALAVIVTLMLATSLNGANSGSPSAARHPSIALPSATRATSTGSPLTADSLTADSLTAPLGAPIHLPWPSAHRPAPMVR